ncbi:hypothetical protein LL966_21580 [Flavobacterium chungbukense]|nr:hypothetical protein [Flavobacterium chungbukense]
MEWLVIFRDHISYLVGTMIEVPRAILTADEIAQYAELVFFETIDHFFLKNCFRLY